MNRNIGSQIENKSECPLCTSTPAETFHAGPFDRCGQCEIGEFTINRYELIRLASIWIEIMLRHWYGIFANPKTSYFEQSEHASFAQERIGEIKKIIGGEIFDQLSREVTQEFSQSQDPSIWKDYQESCVTANNGGDEMTLI